ncbi:MAG TPA: hypothetical protein VGG35_11735 [Streptosporangiaceae bacterium]|jgi:hypothetical protein
MTGLARLAAALLRRLSAVLPAGRRDWAEAVLAEAGQVPAGPRQLTWLAGGLWLAVRESRQALILRAARPLAFAAAAAGLAWAAWRGQPGGPAVAVDRADVMAMTVILAGLPCLLRRRYGPARGRAGQAWRAAGYAVLLSLVAAKGVVERYAYAPPGMHWAQPLLWIGEPFFLLVMAGYTVMLLMMTSRRSRTRPASMAIGAVAGAAATVLACALGPLGAPLHVAGTGPAIRYDAALAAGALLALAAPVAAALAAVRRSRRRDPGGDAARAGVAAGAVAGAAAALLTATTSTWLIALLPGHPGLLRWAAAHFGYYSIGGAPPHGLPDFAAGYSSYAAGYLIVLLLFPLLGCGLAAWPALFAAGSRPPGNGRGGGGGPGPQPAPVPPDRGRSQPGSRPSPPRPDPPEPAEPCQPAQPGSAREAGDLVPA